MPDCLKDLATRRQSAAVEALLWEVGDAFDKHRQTLPRVHRPTQTHARELHALKGRTLAV